MIISRNLINNFLNIKNISDDEIVLALNSLGYEVENYNKLQNENTNIVLGKIIELKKAEDSNRLNLTKVQISKTKIVDIVCAANNLYKNMYVIVALPNAKLGNGIVIKETKIRNHISKGMLCSYTELGYKNKPFANAKGIIDVLGKYANDKYLGSKDILNLLNLNDSIFEYDITLNRSYALSATKCIKELGLFFNKESNDDIKIKISKEKNNFKILNHCVNDVLNYAFVNIEINNKQLDTHISNILKVLDIDAKNLNALAKLVTLETGQPLILLDADKINNKLFFSNNFIDEVNKIDKGDIILTNENDFVSLLGVKQNQNFSVNISTKNILVIAPFVNTTVIRKQQRKYNANNINMQRYMHFNSDVNLKLALERFIEILNSEHYIVKHSEIIEHKNSKTKNHTIQLSFKKLAEWIGNDLDYEKVALKLNKLGFDVKISNQNIDVVIPKYRYNLIAEDDLIEEIARIYGYENIIAKPSILKSQQLYLDKEEKNLEIINNFLINNNFYEAKTFSLVKSEEIKKFNFFNYTNPIHLAKPLTVDHELMRLSILNNLLKATEYNISHQEKNIKLFTIENIHFNNTANMHLALTLNGNIIEHKISDSQIKNSFYYLKGIFIALINKIGLNKNDFIFKKENINSFFNPFQAAKIYYKNELIAVIGKINPKHLQNVSEEIFGLEINLTKLFEIKENKIQYQNKIIHNEIFRDITILLGELKFDEIKKFMKNIKYLQEINLKDYYIDEQKKAFLTLSLIFNCKDRQLTNNEINNEYEKFLNVLKKHKIFVKD